MANEVEKRNGIRGTEEVAWVGLYIPIGGIVES